MKIKIELPFSDLKSSSYNSEDMTLVLELQDGTREELSLADKLEDLESIDLSFEDIDINLLDMAEAYNFESIITAAGPSASGNAGSSGSGDYADNSGELTKGVDALLDLDGLGYAVRDTSGNYFDTSLANAFTPGGAGLAGGDTGSLLPDGTPTEPEGPIYLATEYAHRAVLLLTEGADFIEMNIPLLVDNPNFSLGDISVEYLGGAFQDLLSLEPVEINGEFFLKLNFDASQLSPEDLANLSDGLLSDYLKIQLGNDKIYNLQLLTTQDDNFNSSIFDKDPNFEMSIGSDGLSYEFYGGSSKDYEDYTIKSSADNIYIDQGLKGINLDAPESDIYITSENTKAFDSNLNRSSTSEISGHQVHIDAFDDTLNYGKVIHNYESSLTISAEDGISISGGGSGTYGFHGIYSYGYHNPRYGIDPGETKFETKTGNIDMDFVSSASTVYGIYNTSHSTLDINVLEQGDINLNVLGEGTKNITGMYSFSSTWLGDKTSLSTADGDINIAVSLDGPTADGSYQRAYGLHAYQSGINELTSQKGNISVGIDLKDVSDATNSIYSGLYAYNKADNILTAEDGSIEIYAISNSSRLEALNANSGYNTLTASEDIDIIAKGKGIVKGIFAEDAFHHNSNILAADDGTRLVGNYLKAGGEINVLAHSTDNTAYGIHTYYGASNTLEANKIDIKAITDNNNSTTYGLSTGNFTSGSGNPVDTNIILSGPDSSLNILAEGGKTNYAMYTRSDGTNTIKGEEGAGTGITVTIIAQGGEKNYAMFASGLSEGRNIIEGNSVLGTRDVVDITGDIAASTTWFVSTPDEKYVSYNSITTGSGHDHISLDGVIVDNVMSKYDKYEWSTAASVLRLDAGDGVDILTLKASDAEAFKEQYGTWLGLGSKAEYHNKGFLLDGGHNVEVIHVSGADLEDMPWLLDLVNSFNENNPDQPHIVVLDDKGLGDILEGYDGDLGTGDEYHANLDAIVKWYEDEYLSPEPETVTNEDPSAGDESIDAIAALLAMEESDIPDNISVQGDQLLSIEAFSAKAGVESFVKSMLATENNDETVDKLIKVLAGPENETSTLQDSKVLDTLPQDAGGASEVHDVHLQADLYAGSNTQDQAEELNADMVMEMIKNIGG